MVYVIDVFISICVLCLVLCFMYVSRFNWYIKRTLDLLEWSMELEKQKEVELTLYRIVTLGMTRDRGYLCRLIQVCRLVPLMSLQSIITFQLWAVFVFWPWLLLQKTKCGDSNLSGKKTRRSRTFMKGLSEDKVVWNDKNALKLLYLQRVVILYSKGTFPIVTSFNHL